MQFGKAHYRNVLYFDYRYLHYLLTCLLSISTELFLLHCQDTLGPFLLLAYLKQDRPQQHGINCLPLYHNTGINSTTRQVSTPKQQRHQQSLF